MVKTCPVKKGESGCTVSKYSVLTFPVKKGESGCTVSKYSVLTFPVKKGESGWTVSKYSAYGHRQRLVFSPRNTVSDIVRTVELEFL